jgi:hypothetical protein
MVYRVRIYINRPPLVDKALRYFTTPPCPQVVFQLTSSYLSAIRVVPKDRKMRGYTILPLPPGLVEPHFDRQNLADPPALAEVIKTALVPFHVSGGTAACLVPETCLKILVLEFDSLPSSEKEKDKLIRWRAKKQLPVLPEDARMSYQVLSSDGAVKLLASLGRSAVLQEYEDLFSGLGLEAGVLSAPTLSLLNLIDWANERDVIVANIEDDSMSLVAVIRSEISLYRTKIFAVDRRPDLTPGQKVELIVKEIENTVFFVEDREKNVIRSLWLRAGIREGQEEILTRLGRKIPFSIHAIGASSLSELPLAERTILAPLIGLIP